MAKLSDLIGNASREIAEQVAPGIRQNGHVLQFADFIGSLAEVDFGKNVRALVYSLH